MMTEFTIQGIAELEMTVLIGIIDEEGTQEIEGVEVGLD